jgi:hypothetical protein
MDEDLRVVINERFNLRDSRYILKYPSIEENDMNISDLAYGVIPIVAKKLYDSLSDDDFRPLKAKYGDVIGVRRGRVPGTRLQVYQNLRRRFIR